MRLSMLIWHMFKHVMAEVAASCLQATSDACYLQYVRVLCCCMPTDGIRAVWYDLRTAFSLLLGMQHTIEPQGNSDCPVFGT